MSEAPPAWAAKYVGLRYRERGRTREGLDCWGLVRLVLCAEAAIDLPAYGTVLDAEAAFKKAMTGPDWSKAMPAQALDVMMMLTPTGQGKAAPLHVGVMVTPRIVLHIDEQDTSRMLSAAHPMIAGRFYGFYRHISRT